MSLPHLLLVDDSDAILSFEKAVLSGLYRISTAANGVEALEKIKQLKPEGVLLDLSMPLMDGDEVLKIIKADTLYSGIPFLVVSSEKERAEACLKEGAEGILNKPVLADELKARVALMLEASMERERKKGSAYLFVGVGPYEMGLPLSSILSVHSQPLTQPHKSSESYRSETVDYYGETLEVLDLAGAMGVKYGKSLEDRKLVFLQSGGKMAVCVDRVWDPEELTPDQVHNQGKKEKGGSRTSEKSVLSVVESSRGLLPVLNPEAFFAGSNFPRLAEYLLEQRKKVPFS